MEKNPSPRVFLFPDNVDTTKEKVSVVKLKHPRTGALICCMLAPDGSLYEIVKVSQKYSSWITGNSVVEDGSLHIVTPVDPLFFIIPYINQLMDQRMFHVLEDTLVNEESLDARKLSQCVTSEDVAQIADVKNMDGDDNIFCRYNEQKTLEWLQLKISEITRVLKDKEVDISDGAKASVLISGAETVKNEKEYTKKACALVSEYLPSELSAKLCEELGIVQEKEDIGSSNESTQQRKKTKTENDSEPIEDYSQNGSSQPENKTNKKMNAAQKRLLKVDKKGMKNISSFFSKK